MIAGAIFFAFSNKSLTLDAHTHTNISTNSDHEILKKGTLLSHATALANIVLPVPGGHTRRVHLGIFAQISLNFFGFLRNCTISHNSSFSSSAHATSLNKTLSLSLSYNLALDFQKVIALFATHHILDISTSPITINKINVIIVGSISVQKSSLVLSFTTILVFIVEL
jgi:hypothetical protein